MCNLQDLTLYIQINKRNRLVDDIQLENDVLIHLSNLQRFVFYICTFTSANHPVTLLSNDDIQRTFSNVKFGQVGCSMNYINEFDITYHVFLLPFKFDCIKSIGNSFTNTILKNITCLCVYDGIPFEHEFFVRLARCFPLLKALIIVNCKAQSTDSAKPEHDNNGSFEVVHIDVHRGRTSAAAATPPFWKLNAAPQPHRDTSKKKNHRAALKANVTAPRLIKKKPTAAATLLIVESGYVHSGSYNPLSAKYKLILHL